MKTRAVEGHLLPRGFEFNNNQKKTAFARDPSTQDPSTRPKRRDPSTADPSTGRPKNRPTQAPADQSTARPKHRPTKAPEDARRKTQVQKTDLMLEPVQLPFNYSRVGGWAKRCVYLCCFSAHSASAFSVRSSSHCRRHINTQIKAAHGPGAARYLSWAHGGSWLLN